MAIFDLPSKSMLYYIYTQIHFNKKIYISCFSRSFRNTTDSNILLKAFLLCLEEVWYLFFKRKDISHYFANCEMEELWNLSNWELIHKSCINLVSDLEHERIQFNQTSYKLLYYSFNFRIFRLNFWIIACWNFGFWEQFYLKYLKIYFSKVHLYLKINK